MPYYPPASSGGSSFANSTLRFYGAVVPSNGTTNTAVVRFQTPGAENTGTDITYATDSALGDTFTINTDGIYSISVSVFNATGSPTCITKNSTALVIGNAPLSGNINNMPDSTSLAQNFVNAQNGLNVCWTGLLAATDVIRVQSQRGDLASAQITITRLK